jgi:hypothetical protein
MQNVSVVSRPKMYVLSNGAIIFAVSLKLCKGKWTKLLIKPVLAFNPQILHNRSHPQLTGNKVHPSKTHGN